jgi:trigger factor
MNVAKETLPKNQVALTISVPYADIAKDLEHAAQELSKKAKIDGFRPGKVPFSVMKEKVGEQHILEHAVDRIIQRSFVKAIVEEDLQTVGQPEINVTKLHPGNPIEYKATVAVLPDVKLGDYKTLKVERKPVAVETEEVQKTLGDLRKVRAKDVRAEKPAAEGNKVEVDFSISVDKVPIEGGASKNHPITIGEKNFIPGFEDGLVGMRVGEEKTYPVQFPKEYHAKHLAGKEAEAKVKLNAVYDVQLPELDDAFARSVGNFSTIKDLKSRIAENLKQEKTHREDNRYDMALVDAVRGRSEIGEVPEILIEREKEKMFSELEQAITGQGMRFADYLTSTKKTAETVKADFAPEAKKRVALSLVLRAIGRAEKVTVELEELEKEKNAYLARMPDSEELREQVQSPAFDEYLTTLITNRKVFGILREYARKTHSAETAPKTA